MKQALTTQLEDKILAGEALTAKERAKLEERAFYARCTGDDPKYDASNWNWIRSLTDLELFDIIDC